MDKQSFHIRTLACYVPEFMTVKWNATGYASQVSGFVPEILDLMASRFHFTFSYVPLGRDLSVDDRPNEKGLVSYIRNGEGDLIACGIVRSPERSKQIDFTMPMAEGKYTALIPFPSKSVNDNALYQPFEMNVWLCLLACFFAIVIAWIIIHAIHNRLSLFTCSASHKRIKRQRNETNITYIATTYATGVLLNQGGYFSNKALAIRLVAGVWCLAAYVLVPAYSGNLTSFLTAPIVQPVIDSIDDIPNVVALKVAVERGKAFDANLQSWANSINGSNSRSTLANKLLKITFRCDKTDTCIEKVLAGGHVFIHGISMINQIVTNDLKRRKECRFTVARQPLEPMHIYWGVAKQSAYVTIINKGILEMEAHGLLPYWRNYHLSSVPTRCLINGHRRTKRNKSLKLIELSSTFYLMAAGCLLAVFVFLCERITHRLHY